MPHNDESRTKGDEDYSTFVTNPDTSIEQRQTSDGRDNIEVRLSDVGNFVDNPEGSTRLIRFASDRFDDEFIDQGIQNGHSSYNIDNFIEGPQQNDRFRGSLARMKGQRWTSETIQEPIDDRAASMNWLDEEVILKAVKEVKVSASFVAEFGGLLSNNERTDPDYNVDETKLRDMIQEEFPESHHPSLKELINVGRLRHPRYGPGDWVEIRGQDMKWTLDMITRVIKKAPDDFEWNDPENQGIEPEWDYFYHAGQKRSVTADELRSPQEGLQLMFGLRPWVWQQWACLKLEQTLRFQKGHQNDFENKDMQKYAADLWDEWLYNPKNDDFRVLFFDRRIGDYGRSELVNHIMKPFRLMDRVNEDEDMWDFENDANLSVFTYLSVLGSGYIIPVVMVLLQVAIPLILILESLKHRSKSILGFQLLGKESEEGDDAIDDIGTCLMSLAVMLVYFFKVVPDNFGAFYSTLGASDTAYSRLLSIREEIHAQRKDRFAQKIGYKMDLYMNTTYVCFLYMFNIFIIIDAESSMDVILNALAFQFVARLDEEVTYSDWWDAEKRWIMGGTIELILQDTLSLNCLRSPKQFSEAFDIPENDLLEECDNSPNLFCDKNQSLEDQNDPQFMTGDEKIKNQCREIAINLGNTNAINEYQKPTKHFSIFERYCCSDHHYGMFEKHRNYRTWSRWERILYISPLPDINFFFDKGTQSLSKRLNYIHHTKEEPFLNFDPKKQDGVENKILFIRHFFEVLSLKHMARVVISRWRKKDYTGTLFFFVESVAQWFAYVTQCAFPIYIVLVFVVTAWDLAQREMKETLDTHDTNDSGIASSD